MNEIEFLRGYRAFEKCMVPRQLPRTANNGEVGCVLVFFY